MYKPVKDGIKRGTHSVTYTEELPSFSLEKYVYCFWELKTLSPLSTDFLYHVLPDACVNILFNQLDPKITAITALQTEHKVLNLGKKFHYIDIELLPGVWSGNPNEIKNNLVNKPYTGELSLVELNRDIIDIPNFPQKQKNSLRLLRHSLKMD